SETTSPDTALALARQRLDAHNASAAVDGLQRYLAVYPQELTVKRFLADLYFRIGALTDAEATYRDILQGYPYDTQAHRRLGTLDFLAGRTDAAIVEFEASLPESIDDLVVAHERKGDVDAFEREMQHRAQTSPRDASVQYEMGAVYGDLHLPHDALAYFRRALAIYPSSTDILNGTAIAQMQVHDDAGAEQTFDRCLHYDGESYACTNDLGSLYLDEKRYPDARRVLLRAHGLAPEAPEALVNLGYLSDELGNRAEAVGYYTEAIYVWPYFSDGYVNLSYDQIRQGSFDQAESVLHKGLAVAPADPRMHYLLGIVDEVRGNRPEAVAEFQRAETSNDPDIVNSARQSVDDLQKSMPASESAPPASRPPSPLR
ncbi:MAG TPA: tetratricopeptide repeat protein, partial [Candidatus Tumulicola sp.]|nr:tetratricopeptide repeat protein [Candidatus Tumulicola sp.]